MKEILNTKRCYEPFITGRNRVEIGDIYSEQSKVQLVFCMVRYLFLFYFQFVLMI